MKKILFEYTRDELKELFREVISEKGFDHKPSKKKIDHKFIKGIHGLAKFLDVSPARAQKLKNEGVISYWQDGRTVLFDPETILEEMRTRK